MFFILIQFEFCVQISIGGETSTFIKAVKKLITLFKITLMFSPSIKDKKRILW